MDRELAVQIAIIARNAAEQALKDARRQIRDVERAGNDASRGGLARLRDGFRQAADASRALAGAVAVAAGAITGLGLGAVRLAGQLEQSRIAFTTLLGSAEAAGTYLRELMDFAARTPFEFRGLQDSSRLLLAFGFNAEATIPILRILGDATSALGGSTAELEGITRALGQIQTKGKVSTEELLQLAERGIPAFEILQEQLGLTGDQVANIGTLGIDSTTAITALLTGLAERFSGSMQQQSETLLGLFSTTRDEISFLLTDLGERIAEALNLKGVLQAANAAIGGFRQRLESEGLAGMFEEIRGEVTLLAGALLGALTPALLATAAAVGRLVARLAPWAAAGALAAQVAIDMGVTFDDLRVFLTRFNVAATGVWNGLRGGLKNITTEIRIFARTISTLWDLISGIATNIGQLFEAMRSGNFARAGAIQESLAQQLAGLPARFAEAGRESRAAFQAELIDAEALKRSAETLLSEAFSMSREQFLARYGEAYGGLGAAFQQFVETAQGTGAAAFEDLEGMLAELEAALGATGGEFDATGASARAAADDVDRLAEAIREFQLQQARSAQLQGGNFPGDQGANAARQVGITPSASVGRAPSAAASRAMRGTDPLDRLLERYHLQYQQALTDAARVHAQDEAAAVRRQVRAQLEYQQSLEAAAALREQDEAAAVRAAVRRQLEYQESLRAAAALRNQDEAAAVRAAVRRQVEYQESLRAAAALHAREEAAESRAQVRRQVEYQQSLRDAADLHAREEAAETRRMVRYQLEYQQSLRDAAAALRAAPAGALQGIFSTGPRQGGSITFERGASVGQHILDGFRPLLEQLPFVANILTNLAGGPLQVIAGIIADLIGSTRGFQNLLELVSRSLEPILIVLDQLLTALMPVIEPLLRLNAALAPLLEVVVKLLTPALRVVGGVVEALAAIVNGVVDVLVGVYNFLLGWLLGRIDPDEARRRRYPDEDEPRRTDRTDPFESYRPGAGRGSAGGFASAPPAVQMAVYAPLVDAIQQFVIAAREFAAGGSTGARPYTAVLAQHSTAMIRHAVALDRSSTYLDRLAREGIRVHLQPPASGRSPSRTLLYR